MDLLRKLDGVVLGMFGILPTSDTMNMAGANTRTEMSVQFGRDLWDIGRNHPRLFEKHVLLTFDTGPEPERTSIKLCQRELLLLDELCDLRLSPISAYPWPLKQDWDRAGNRALLVKP